VDRSLRRASRSEVSAESGWPDSSDRVANSRRLVQPVFSRGIEDVEVHVSSSAQVVRHVRGCTALAGANDDLLAIDGKFQRAF